MDVAKPGVTGCCSVIRQWRLQCDITVDTEVAVLWCYGTVDAAVLQDRLTDI